MVVVSVLQDEKVLALSFYNRVNISHHSPVLFKMVKMGHYRWCILLRLKIVFAQGNLLNVQFLRSKSKACSPNLSFRTKDLRISDAGGTVLRCIFNAEGFMLRHTQMNSTAVVVSGQFAIANTTFCSAWFWKGPGCPARDCPTGCQGPGK